MVPEYQVYIYIRELDCSQGSMMHQELFVMCRLFLLWLITSLSFFFSLVFRIKCMWFWQHKSYWRYIRSLFYASYIV